LACPLFEVPNVRFKNIHITLMPLSIHGFKASPNLLNRVGSLNIGVFFLVVFISKSICNSEECLNIGIHSPLNF